MREPRRMMVVFLGMVLLAMMACALPFDNPLEEKPAGYAGAGIQANGCPSSRV